MRKLTSREQRLREGLCESCDEVRLPYSFTVCEKHWFMNITGKALKTKTLWEELKQVAEDQNYICPYFGDKLVPGFNMSLDHIKPIKLFPELRHNVSNFQWTTVRINRMKRTMSHEEFVEYYRNKGNICTVKGCKDTRLDTVSCCEKHWFKDKSTHLFSNNRFWKELRQLLIDQKHKCIYSGKQLVLGLNITIDHIKSVSLFPELKSNISNLQWVDNAINAMKGFMSHEEFIEYFNSVYGGASVEEL